jgi:hypothetical protein
LHLNTAIKSVTIRQLIHNGNCIGAFSR